MVWTIKDVSIYKETFERTLKKMGKSVYICAKTGVGPGQISQNSLPQNKQAAKWIYYFKN